MRGKLDLALTNRCGTKTNVEFYEFITYRNILSKPFMAEHRNVVDSNSPVGNIVLLKMAGDLECDMSLKHRLG